MAKKVRALIKLQIQAGEATPAPPVGPALGQHGVNIMGFVKEYNSKTANQKGSIIPVQITVFEDRSFTFVTKTPPASELIRKSAGVEKGGERASHETIGKITRAELKTIAETKQKDLSAASLDAVSADLFKVITNLST